MPAWWKGKLNGKSKEEGCSMAFKQRREAWKEKANSADETRSSIESAHPLPLPSQPMADLMAAAAPGSASASSVSSSGSLEDTPNLGFCRLSNTINMRSRQTLINPKKHRNIGNGRRHFSCGPVLEHPRCYELPVSPKKEVHSPGVSYREVMFNSKMLNCAPSSRPPLSKLPIHPVSLRICPGSPSGRQEELRSPPHPLPLPPKSSISPSSLSSRSSQKRWKKGKLLGRGTFGHVYLGFNSESGQMCAIKEVTLISDDSISRESLKQLNQELNLLRQLSHSNIVQYYGSELVDETLAIYLEYVSGGSIYKLLQEYGPFGEPVLRNYTAQILSGLAYLHGRNTVHRDIKGANILVDPNGEIKLADFGMAKHISSFTSIRSLKGSPYWMAPEVIMNGRGYNLSVDIWSLGCTVLEMATGKPPWSQFEGVAAIFKLGNSNDIPDIPDHLTSETRSFLRLCLVRDPSARPTATQLMDHPFVCDQPAIKAAKSSMMREILHSCYSMAKEGVHIDSNASSSIHKKHGIGSHDTTPFLNKTPSCNDLMALPFSSSSSPLLQSRQRNRSCSFLSSLNNLPPYHCPRR